LVKVRDVKQMGVFDPAEFELKYVFLSRSDLIRG